MGKVTVVGGKPAMKAPSTGVLASELAVGSTVKLMENGVATEYLVVNQGVPSNSTKYHSSCDGTWLLRKYVCDADMKYGNTNSYYKNSTIHEYLNGTFLGSLGTVEQSAIKSVNIPCVDNINMSSMTITVKELSARVFLLSVAEVYSFSTLRSDDGAAMSYFSANGSQVAYKKGASAESKWWLRTPSGTANVFLGTSATSNTTAATNTSGVRPALIVPSTACFDEKTMLLKEAG